MAPQPFGGRRRERAAELGRDGADAARVERVQAHGVLDAGQEVVLLGSRP
ncbi:hypothetical protein [Pseudonocardia sp. HH130629-09]|nr:hypothetical protein [Pseudonocardia sp. HH130629-09]